jgi:hypothetical protein
MILRVGQGLRRCDHDVVPRVDPHPQHVLHVADDDAVVGAVAHYLVFNLLPPSEVLFNEDLMSHGAVEAPFDYSLELGSVLCHPPSFATKGVCDPDDDRVAKAFRNRLCFLEGVHGGAIWDGDSGAHHRLLEKVPVFGELNPPYRGPKNFDSVFFEGTTPGEFDAAVEGCLASEAEEDGIGPLALDYSFDEVGDDGDEVYAV